MKAVISMSAVWQNSKLVAGLQNFEKSFKYSSLLI
jgi:hypothetical protein